MNEQIRELAEQATKHYPATESSGEFSTFDKEKFAELIVKECADVVEGFVLTEEVSLDEYVDYEASDVLKKHFGVQE